MLVPLIWFNTFLVTHLSLNENHKESSSFCISQLHVAESFLKSLLVKKVSAFYGIQRLPCLQELTTGPCLEPVETYLYPICSRSALVLSSHQCFSLPTDLFPSGFLIKILYTFHISPMCATCPFHFILDFISSVIFCKEYKLWCSSLCIFLHPSVTSSVRSKYSQTSSVCVLSI